MRLTQQMRTKSSFIAIYCDLQTALHETDAAAAAGWGRVRISLTDRYATFVLDQEKLITTMMLIIVKSLS